MAVKDRLVKFLEVLLLCYLMICLYMWSYQRRLMYLPENDIQQPAAYGLADFETVRLTTRDGVNVQAWQHPARPGYPTVIYFHGNGGNMGSRASYYKLLSDEGFGVLALDYRGYGASEGAPSEDGFYKDAAALIDYGAKQLYLTPDKVILYGESIGTGVAVQMALRYQVAAVVLQSPFTSLLARGEALYPWLPVAFLEYDRFDSLKKIRHIHAPLLLFHGEDDDIVPVTDGKSLFAHAAKPKEAIYFPHKGHSDLDPGQLSDALLQFCRKHALITPQNP